MRPSGIYGLTWPFQVELSVCPDDLLRLDIDYSIRQFRNEYVWRWWSLWVRPLEPDAYDSSSK